MVPDLFRGVYSPRDVSRAHHESQMHSGFGRTVSFVAVLAIFLRGKLDYFQMLDWFLDVQVRVGKTRLRHLHDQLRIVLRVLVSIVFRSI